MPWWICPNGRPSTCLDADHDHHAVCCLLPGAHRHELPTKEDLAAVITQRSDQHLSGANLAQSDSQAPGAE